MEQSPACYQSGRLPGPRPPRPPLVGPSSRRSGPRPPSPRRSDRGSEPEPAPARPPASARLGRRSGGLASPPALRRGARNPTAHSAVTAGGPKRPGDDEIERRPQSGSGEHLGPAAHDLDPVAQAEPLDRRSRGTRSGALGVEQHARRRRPLVEQHQARESAAAPEVEEVRSAVGPTRDAPDRAAWSICAFERPGAEQPELPGVLEDATRRGCEPSGSEARSRTAASGSGRRSTTRRRGSSPSDAVAMPSISATVSWTTLRSLADIGSSACGRPVSSTFSASFRVKSASASRRLAR